MPKFTFAVEVQEKGDSLKTLPIIEALNHVSDIFNHFSTKAFASMNEFMQVSTIAQDYVTQCKSMRLKRENSI